MKEVFENGGEIPGAALDAAEGTAINVAMLFIPGPADDAFVNSYRAQKAARAAAKTFSPSEALTWLRQTAKAIPPQMRQKLDDIIVAIPKAYKEVLQCDKFADELIKGAKAAGIRGERLFVQAKGGHAFIESARLDPNCSITRTGIHEGVRIGNMVFDNISPQGVPYEQWVKDFTAREGIDFLPVSGMACGTPKSWRNILWVERDHNVLLRLLRRHCS